MISIAMTTYNGEKYLREQIDSILSQIYSDFELIICDDCSSDDTRKILSEYAKKDKRVKVFFNKNNLGFKKNFEKAINLCTGDFIALSDQDDIWFANHLKILLENLKDFSMSVGNAVLVDSFGKELGQLLNQNEGLYILPSDKQKLIYRIILGGNCFQGASSLFRASFIKKVLPIPNDVLYHDAWFAACATMDRGISYTFTPITYYRQHGNNVTAKVHSIKQNWLEKCKSLFSILCGKRKLLSDRFAYCKEIGKIYGFDNKDFEQLCRILNDINVKVCSLKDIFFLWKNYEYIRTQKGHKGFLKMLIIWNMWTTNSTIDRRMNTE